MFGASTAAVATEVAASWQVSLAAAIFLAVYAIIVSEKIDRTVIALVGAVLMIGLGLISQEAGIRHIDFNTLGLLVGMMIIVGITKRTGVFEYIAIKAAKLAKGEPLPLLIILGVITAVASALLDNVTTVMLMVPVTFSIAGELKVNPIPFLIVEIMTSNIGGSATLIGDPPNIMIGSAVPELGFNEFLLNLGPAAAIILALTLLAFYFIYRKEFNVTAEAKARIMAYNEAQELKDQALLAKCGTVLGLTILGFVLHQALHLESATVALAGATLLMLWSKWDPEHVFEEVEWPTIFFFIGLFVLVGALVEVGLISILAEKSLDVTKGNMALTSMLILWVSGIASAFLDNIPFVATMIPMIQQMGQLGGITDLNTLWWSLALGADLGGNGTIVGASANVIVAGLAARHGHPLGFVQYMKIAFPLMIGSLIVSTLYIYLRYLM